MSLYSRLVVEKVGSRMWRLESKFETPYVTIPEGFESNGASSPRILWSIISPATRFFEAAIVHDYLLYQRRQGVKISLEYCNQSFYGCALHFGARKFLAKLAYVAVTTYTNLTEKRVL